MDVDEQDKLTSSDFAPILDTLDRIDAHLAAIENALSSAAESAKRLGLLIGGCQLEGKVDTPAK